VYTQVCVPFETGDLFCFYSDGVTEARNPAGELFGFDRLADAIRNNRQLDPEELVARIRQVVIAFSNSETFTDDLTCVVVRVEPISEAGARQEAGDENSHSSAALSE